MAKKIAWTAQATADVRGIDRENWIEILRVRNRKDDPASEKESL